MGDQYQETVFVGWGEKIGNSCLGALLGVALFFASFFVLYWNEGRVDLSQIAKTAVEIAATTENPSAQGKLVAVTGAITSNQLLGDELFLQPGPHIFIDRTVEMFAWDEDKQTKTEKHAGGSETKTTTYTYSKAWTNDPENSGDFKYAQAHHNPPKAVPDQLYKVPNATVGRYSLETGNFAKVINHRCSCATNCKSYSYPTDGGRGINLPANGQLLLNQQAVKPNSAMLLGDYLFKGTGSPQNPQIGDLRICYSALSANTTVTVFGQLAAENRLIPHSDDRITFYRIFPSGRNEAIAALATEYQIWTWVFRGTGFLMMWIGLALAASPISAVLGFIPFLGFLSESIAGAASFLTALLLSITTILISRLIHHPGVLLVSIAVTFGVVFMLRNLKSKI